MLDQDFCEYLEFELSKALSNSTDKTLKGFWCDGILLPNSSNEISKKYINDNREIVLTAFIGFDGQEQYSTTLKFGEKSLSKYARDLNIEDCIPDVMKNDWYDIDTTIKTLTIYLL